jgi:hypothetical protein
MPEGEQKSNGASLKDLKDLNWPTLILILVTGGGNFFATAQNSKQVSEDTYRALGQIRDLHDALDEFETRQKKILEGIGQSLNNQTTILANQNKVLEELKQDHH